MAYNAIILDSTPYKGLLYSYRSLPTTLTDNISAFHNFFSKYGSHVRKRTIFGSVMEIIPHKLEDIQTKEEMISYVDMLLKNPNLIRSIYSPTGNESLTTVDWINKAIKNPVPLISEVIPIYDYIEPDSDSERKQSLKTMYNYLVNRANLLIAKYSLELFDQNTSMAKFLIRTTNSNAKSLCPADDVVNAVKKILENSWERMSNNQ